MSVSLVKVPRATADDAGCWIDGHWGQYGTARMVLSAFAYGYSDAGVIGVANRHLRECVHLTNEHITEDEHQMLLDSADEVEEWLNTYVAPVGYSFGWHDGEFFLWSDEQWEDDAY